MCIKCEIEKMMLEVMGKEKVETELGTIGRGYIKEITQLEEAQDILDEQIESAVKKAAEEGLTQEEMEAIVAPKFEKKFEDLLALRKKVFNEALQAAGVDKTVEELAETDFKLDKVTGVISVIEIKDKPEEGQEEYDVAPGVH